MEIKELLKDVQEIGEIRIVGRRKSGTALVLTSDLDLWILLKEEYKEEDLIKRHEVRYAMDMMNKEDRVLVQQCSQLLNQTLHLQIWT